MDSQTLLMEFVTNDTNVTIDTSVTEMGQVNLLAYPGIGVGRELK